MFKFCLRPKQAKKFFQLTKNHFYLPKKTFFARQQKKALPEICKAFFCSYKFVLHSILQINKTKFCQNKEAFDSKKH